MTRRPLPITKLIDQQQTEVDEQAGTFVGQGQVIADLNRIAVDTPARTVTDALGDITIRFPNAAPE
jgi:hypothetical protein